MDDQIRHEPDYNVFAQLSFPSFLYRPMATPNKDQLIRFRCECGKKLKATRDIIGRKVQCTQCPRIHRVPESDRLGPKPTKKPKPTSKLTPETKPETTPTTKTSPAKQASTAATSAPKKKTASTSKAGSAQPPTAQDKPQPTATGQQPSLFINDEMAAKEPSLLPSSDDSGARFKLDPKFDPEPTEQLPAADNIFDFDPEDLQLNTNAPTNQDNQLERSGTKSQAAFNADDQADHKPAGFPTQHSRYRHSISKTTMLASAAILLSLMFLTAIGWFVFSESSLPTEFTERPEVRNYVTKIKEFRKSQQTLKIVSEAYVKSKSPTPLEREQIETFNRSIEPLANKEEKLTEALKLFQASQVEKARLALIAATETLDQKIPELQARAKDFSSKLR